MATKSKLLPAPRHVTWALIGVLVAASIAAIVWLADVPRVEDVFSTTTIQRRGAIPPASSVTFVVASIVLAIIGAILARARAVRIVSGRESKVLIGVLSGSAVVATLLTIFAWRRASDFRIRYERDFKASVESIEAQQRQHCNDTAMREILQRAREQLPEAEGAVNTARFIRCANWHRVAILAHQRGNQVRVAGATEDQIAAVVKNTIANSDIAKDRRSSNQGEAQTGAAGAAEEGRVRRYVDAALTALGSGAGNSNVVVQHMQRMLREDQDAPGSAIGAGDAAAPVGASNEPGGSSANQTAQQGAGSGSAESQADSQNHPVEDIAGAVLCLSQGLPPQLCTEIIKILNGLLGGSGRVSREQVAAVTDIVVNSGRTSSSEGGSPSAPSTNGETGPGNIGDTDIALRAVDSLADRNRNSPEVRRLQQNSGLSATRRAFSTARECVTGLAQLAELASDEAAFLQASERRPCVERAIEEMNSYSGEANSEFSGTTAFRRCVWRAVRVANERDCTFSRGVVRPLPSRGSSGGSQ